MENELFFHILLNEELYVDAMRFLGTNQAINHLLEEAILKNKNLYQQNLLHRLPLNNLQKLTDGIATDIIRAYNRCAWFTLTSKQQKEIKISLFDLIKIELKKLGFYFYKENAYLILQNPREIFTQQELKNLIKALFVYVRQIVDEDQCIRSELVNFFRHILNNMNRVLIHDLPYEPIFVKSTSSSLPRSRFYRYGF
jgi:hypothetical protein